MIQKRVLEAIKEYLERVYGLDMYSQDVRFAYVCYYAYMQEFDDIVTMRNIIKGAYEIIDNPIFTYVAFERSIYRAMEKIFDNSSTHDFFYNKKVLELVKNIKL